MVPPHISTNPPQVHTCSPSRKEVGKNIKDKKRDKRGRYGALAWEGSLKKREVSKNREPLSLPSLWLALEPQRATKLGHSDHARQTPGHLSYSDLGRAPNAGPTESAPLRTTQVPEPERLRPGRCMQPRASLGWFPMDQPRA